MKCSTCGKDISNDSTKCIFCGSFVVSKKTKNFESVSEISTFAKALRARRKAIASFREIEEDLNKVNYISEYDSLSKNKEKELAEKVKELKGESGQENNLKESKAPIQEDSPSENQYSYTVFNPDENPQTPSKEESNTSLEVNNDDFFSSGYLRPDEIVRSDENLADSTPAEGKTPTPTSDPIVFEDTEEQEDKYSESGYSFAQSSDTSTEETEMKKEPINIEEEQPQKEEIVFNKDAVVGEGSANTKKPKAKTKVKKVFGTIAWILIIIAALATVLFALSYFLINGKEVETGSFLAIMAKLLEAEISLYIILGTLGASALALLCALIQILFIHRKYSVITFFMVILLAGGIVYYYYYIEYLNLAIDYVLEIFESLA